MDYGIVKPYDVETNAKIEHAYKNKEVQVIIYAEDDDVPYEIDFDKMIKTNLETGEILIVKRREKPDGK